MTEPQTDIPIDNWDQKYGHLLPPVWPPVEKPLTYREIHSRAVEPLKIRVMLYERPDYLPPVEPKVKTGKFSDYPQCVQDFINAQDEAFFMQQLGG